MSMALTMNKQPRLSVICAVKVPDARLSIAEAAPRSGIHWKVWPASPLNMTTWMLPLGSAHDGRCTITVSTGCAGSATSSTSVREQPSVSVVITRYDPAAS